jgi:predicted dithiol-disulfide oxidoreductase (DUF899 family)
MRSQAVTYKEWTRPRRELGAVEKEVTRQRDPLTRCRMVLPWERVEKPYQFEGQPFWADSFNRIVSHDAPLETEHAS